jgi:hypothetical protein
MNSDLPEAPVPGWHTRFLSHEILLLSILTVLDIWCASRVACLVIRTLESMLQLCGAIGVAIFMVLRTW